MKIPITKAVFDEAERQAVLKPLETGWLVQGPHVLAFEKKFAAFTKSNYAQATSNCTTALHLGLQAMNIKQDDKVVVPSFTYIASANAVEYTGAQVIFCDIDLKTFNIDLNALEKLLQSDKKIKAVMPVHLFGLCAEMPTLMMMAKRYNVKVIEDAACAFDAWIGEEHAGTFGDCGCFSFHPRKSITTGEGGMLITQDENLSQKVSQLKDHGADKSDLQRHEKGGSLLPEFNMRGYNYRMTDLQGALGVCQLEKSQYIMRKRRRVAKQYHEALKNIQSLVLPYIPDNYIHSYQSFVCLFAEKEQLKHLSLKTIDDLNKHRNIFMNKLEKKGIATRQGTHAIHTLNYYKKRYSLKDEQFLMSYAADRLSVTLPLYAEMTQEEFNYVIENIQQALI